MFPEIALQARWLYTVWLGLCCPNFSSLCWSCWRPGSAWPLRATAAWKPFPLVRIFRFMCASSPSQAHLLFFFALLPLHGMCTVMEPLVAALLSLVQGWYWQPRFLHATGPPWFQLGLGLDFKSRDMGTCRGSIPPRGRYCIDLLFSCFSAYREERHGFSSGVHSHRGRCVYCCFFIFLSSPLSYYFAILCVWLASC